MELAEIPGCRSHELARRFLQTAVVIDDESYIDLEDDNGPEVEIVAPGRHTRVLNQEAQNQIGRGSVHSLNARPVIDSFSALGVICGVISPSESTMEVMKQADIVVLDWLLQDGDSKYTLDLFHNLVAENMDDRHALRLIAIYTGEAQLEDICRSIVEKLKETGLDSRENENKTIISYRHGRVVLYAKSEVNLPKHLKNRSITEDELPKKLVRDFAEMTQGLLPGIALTSLTAVREGAHKVLDQFRAGLDPAFLAHRACISNPDEAERQFVNHVAEELRGLMDNAVAEQSPAGADTVERWIRQKNGKTEHFTFGDRLLDMEQAIKLARKGLKASDDLGDNAFESLSSGFSGNQVANLDEQLAWIMSFRTVFNAPPPTLWLGSVVTTMMDGEEIHLICMRPRCDCIRLDEETSFFFLPLIEPEKGRKQLVVRFGDEFKRLGIGFDSSEWVLKKFKPSEDKRPIVATKRGGNFEFTDTTGKRYTWRGELKDEYAQRIAQTFATKMSLVAVDESEWLRRIERKSRK